MRYRADRGGHAPEHLREAFQVYLEKGPSQLDKKDRGLVEIGGEVQPIRWLVGQLWNCTDIMPSGPCETLVLHQGSTYAQGARALAQILL